MPLSEHEQHQLEQMEQALYAEDPKFASQMQGSAVRALLRRRFLVAALAVIGGLGLVVFGVAQNKTWLGAIGFALMVGGVAYAINPSKTPKAGLGAVAQDGTVRSHTPGARAGKTTTGRSRKPGKRSGAKQSFMRRVEERWNRRHND